MKPSSATPGVRELVSAQEWALRVNLAACYRLLPLYGMSDLVFTHISARVPGPEHQFLINPYGMLFDEVTASSLVKVDMQCRKVMDSPWPVNPAGFVIHSCVHAARPEIRCVLHTHTRAGIAVGAQKQGLLPISQQSTFVLPALGYHDYEGVALRDEEKPRLQAALGDNQFLILRNHGLLTVGSSVAEAFLAMYTLESACRIQVSAQAGGGELVRVDPRILEGMAQVIQAVTQGQGAGIAWPGLLRRLDRVNPGYAD